jgi:DNA polymerase
MSSQGDPPREIRGMLTKYLQQKKADGQVFMDLFGAGEAAAARSGDQAEAADGMTLKELRASIGDCQKCKILATNRTNLVFGDGSPDADLVFVGEAPGQEEDRQGIPFVGRAGQLLTKIINAMGMQRSEVYIMNVLKCRPPGNRDPQPDEVENCNPFFIRQLEILKPKVIVALGKYSSQTLLNTTIPISRLRGEFYDYRDIPLMPTYHPSYLLRNQSGKKDVWKDMQEVMKLLEELKQ